MRNIGLFFAFGVLAGVFLLPSFVVVGLEIALWLAAKQPEVEHNTHDPTTSTKGSRLYPGRGTTHGSTVQGQG